MQKPAVKLLRAFTLVEILVTVSIIGLLLTFSFAGLQGARSSARDSQRKSDIEDLRSALEIYRADCGSYPAAVSFGSQLTGTGVGNCVLDNVYMSKVPQDPQNSSKSLVYEYVQSGLGYTVCSSLEHPSSTPFPCAGVADKKCGTTGCSFSKTNP